MTNETRQLALDDLPDEIKQQILHYVSPEDVLRHFQLASRNCFRIASDSALWRYYCQSSFKYWHPDHNIRAKIKSRDRNVNWKKLFLVRKRRNTKISALLDSIITNRVRRYHKIEQICLLGYDAKDFLLEQCRADDPAEDVLARRYFSNAILDAIHRGLAIQEWGATPVFVDKPFYFKTPKGSQVRRLERVLGAYDMFFLKRDDGDLDSISQAFDDMCSNFLGSQDEWDSKTIRQKALALNSWLRARNLTGMSDPLNKYRRLRNCLIGHALLDPEHNSLPIISVAIFCAIACRLGLCAVPLAFPGHVHATVMRTDNEGLDGPTKTRIDDDEDFCMYLDPYGTDAEILYQDLEDRLIEAGWSDNDYDFAPATNQDLVIRMAKNIRAACALFLSRARLSPAPHDAGDDPNLWVDLLYGDGPDTNALVPDSAAYAVTWATVLAIPPEADDWRSLLSPLLAAIYTHHPEDVWLAEKLLVPLWERHTSRHPAHRSHSTDQNPSDLALALRRRDRTREPAVPRNDLAHARVRFRIGQVIRHKRFGFVGVIKGWNLGDREENVWSCGLYYTCLRYDIKDGPYCRVAENNIEIVTDPAEVPKGLVALAGEHFKRFDRDRCEFVSNIREIFPDD